MKKIARILVIALLASLLNVVASVIPAHSAPGKLTEDFTTASLYNPDKWVASSSGSFGAHPCLTALNDSNPAINLSQGTTLPGCGNNPDASGSGALYLTSNDNQQAGTMLYNQALPTAGGLDISFYQAQYAGNGADGISFFVKDGSKTDLTVGQPGGNLGYKGIPGALFGVGFDSFGNWMNQGYGDGACTNNILGGVPKALAIRGPDTSAAKDGTSGFCLLPGGFVAPNGAIGSDYFGTPSDTMASAARPVRILVDPSTNVNPKIRVYMWKSGSLTQDVATAPIQLVADQPAEYKNAGTFKFGFSSSTGGAKDIHAIWGLQIVPLNSASAPTVYVVPSNATVRAGEAAVYTFKFYSDAAKTQEIAASTLSYTQNMCSSSYTLATDAPASLPITCTGTVAMYNTVTTDTATLTVVRGTPSISPATRTITGNSGTAITTTTAYTARNFQYPLDVRYAVSPSLPSGLSLDPVTGVISGTTTVIGSTTHTVTATAVSESATASLAITIGAPLTYAYNITYDKGTGVSGTLAAQTGTASSVTLSAFSTSTFLKPGYTFSGWLGSNAVSYTDAQVLTLTAPLTVTLTAQWTANPSRTVTYSAGTGTGTVPTQADVLQGASFTVAAGTGITKPGYTFAGWKDESGTSYAAASTYTVAATNVLLTAQWTANAARTVTYFAGTGSGTVPTQADVLEGATFTVAAGTGLTKPGYTFAGWKDGTSTSYSAGSTYTAATTNVFLIAQWNANAARTVTYSAGTGTGTVPTQADVLEGASFTVASGTGISKTGSAFSGWKDESGASYSAGSTYTVAGVNVLLTAQWVVNTYPYAISYEANGGSGTMPGQTGLANSVTLLTNTFTYAGYTFAGWKDDANVSYTNGQTITLAAPTSLALHAQWTKNIAAYAISFESGGGVGTMAGQTGSDSSVKLNPNTFTRPGYTFSGWKDGAGVSYTDQQLITFTGAISLALRAQWTANPARTVTYSAGTGTGTVPTQADVLQGLTFIVAAGTGLAKPGYTFAGWKDGTGADFAVASTYTVAGTNVLLTAQWTANPTRTVTYSAGTGTGTVPTQADVLQGATFTVAAGTGVTKPGYTFAGWKDESGTAYAAASTYTVAGVNVLLTAQWTANPTRTVTYSAGTGTGTLPIQADVLQGATFTVAAGTGLAKPGYTFAGWKDESGTAYAAASTYLVAGVNVLLTAQWDLIPIINYSYAISYEANGGTGTMAGQTGLANSVTLSPNTFTYAGYTFAGWKDDAGVSYINGQKITFTAATSLALHAQWSKNPAAYAISFDANGGTGTMAGQTGSESPVKLNPNTFTRSGFVFAGWKDAAGVSYNEQQVITFTGSISLALRAQWIAGTIPVFPYAISFESNGGTGAMLGQTGTASSVVLTMNKFTKGKSIFSGWKDDAGIDYVDGQTISITKPTSIALHAQWIDPTALGIDGIKCLGNFITACALKPGAAQPVSFKINSNLLTPKSIAILKKWKLQTAKSVIIYGYASMAGSKALNAKLTAKRAQEVGAWVKKNWPNLTVKTQGLGTKVNPLCKAFDNKCAMIKIVALKK